MVFDRQKPHAPIATRTTHAAAVPGKQTLTQGLVQLRPSAPGALRAPDVVDVPAPATPTGAARPTLQMLFGGHGVEPDQVHAAAARGVATPASPLPHGEQIQRLFGRHDISSIQAHTGRDAAASAQDMGARAYATGNHVVLADPGDLHTAAHEAAHVIQQRGGVQLQGGVGAVGDAYEQHADAVADRVVRGESAEDLLGRAAGEHGAGGGAGAVQRASINPAAEFGATRADNNIRAGIAANRMDGFGTTVNGAGWHTKVTFDPLRTPGPHDGVHLHPEGSGVTAIVGPDHPYGSQPGSPTAAANNLSAAGLRGGTPHVAAHVLNDQLGGPGVDQNLFAFPGTANTLMETQVEGNMKAAVQSGHYIYYRAVVHHPATGPADYITMSWNKLDHDGNDIGGGQNNAVIRADNTAANQALVDRADGTAGATPSLLNPDSPNTVKTAPWGPFQMPDPKRRIELEPFLDWTAFPAVGTARAFSDFLTSGGRLRMQLALTTLLANLDYRNLARRIEDNLGNSIRARGGRGISRDQVNVLKTGTNTEKESTLLDILESSEKTRVIPIVAGWLHTAARSSARGRV